MFSFHTILEKVVMTTKNESHIYKSFYYNR